MATRQVMRRKKVETRPQRETGRLIRTTWRDMIMEMRYAGYAVTSREDAGEALPCARFGAAGVVAR